MSIAQESKVIVVPDARGGSSTAVTNKAPEAAKKAAQAHINNLMSNGIMDENLVYLQTKLRDFRVSIEGALMEMKQAVMKEDYDNMSDAAHQMTIDTGKVGAIKMMRLCIAIQMLGRRGMIENARKLIAELEKEYMQVIDGLMPVTA